MLGSITPLGERGRRSRWGVTMSAFVLGSGAAGAVMGAALGRIGEGAPLPSGSGHLRLTVLGGLIAIGLLLDLRTAGPRLPTVQRQVNEDWLHRYRGWVYGIGFGFQLGLGVVTVVNVSAVYTAMAAALLSGSTARGLAIGAAFSLIRAGTAFSVAGVRRPDQLVRVDARLRAWDGPSRTASLGLELALAGACLVAAVA